MKNISSHLEELKHKKRKQHDILIDKIHSEYNISKKTLFYIKEYGPKANVIKTIIKESFFVLILTSFISSTGGFALEKIKNIVVSLTPLVILIPVLNDMIGDYGVILSAKISTLIHEGKINKNNWKSTLSNKLFHQIFIISIITTILSTIVAFVTSRISNYSPTIEIFIKITLISLIDVVLMVCILYLISIKAGLYYFNKGEDPNNFLIPISTSIADFGNMIIIWFLVKIIF